LTANSFQLLRRSVRLRQIWKTARWWGWGIDVRRFAFLVGALDRRALLSYGQIAELTSEGNEQRSEHKR
jgi:hypothetical protein